jgi:hypothetical protein
MEQEERQSKTKEFRKHWSVHMLCIDNRRDTVLFVGTTIPIYSNFLYQSTIVLSIHGSLWYSCKCSLHTDNTTEFSKPWLACIMLSTADSPLHQVAEHIH